MRLTISLAVRCLARRLAVGLVVGSGLCLTVSACSFSDHPPIDVYVASSLGEVFEQLAEDFEAESSGVEVRLNIAGSATLVRQINAGARADIIVPADIALLDQLTTQAPQPGTIFASNSLVLVTSTGPTESDVAAVEDLERSDIVVARCAKGLPCGDATSSFLEAHSLALQRPSEHLNVQQVFNQVATGEADAGFVYLSNTVREPNAVKVIALQDPPRVRPAIAVLNNDRDDGRDAQAFVEFVKSPAGSQTLIDFGFELPQS